jgi:hypothetical protein
MAPFGFPRSPRFGRYFGWSGPTVVKLRDGAEQFAAMTQQNAKVLQILVCQIADDREVNAILGKALSVL